MPGDKGPILVVAPAVHGTSAVFRAGADSAIGGDLGEGLARQRAAGIHRHWDGGVGSVGSRAAAAIAELAFLVIAPAVCVTATTRRRGLRPGAIVPAWDSCHGSSSRAVCVVLRIPAAQSSARSPQSHQAGQPRHASVEQRCIRRGALREHQEAIQEPVTGLPSRHVHRKPPVTGGCCQVPTGRLA